jgi:hypothetical protein
MFGTRCCEFVHFGYKPTNIAVVRNYNKLTSNRQAPVSRIFCLHINDREAHHNKQVDRFEQ